MVPTPRPVISPEALAADGARETLADATRGATPVLAPPADEPALQTFSTPADTLRHDEVLRIRRFVIFCMCMIVMGAAFTPFSKGDPLLRAMLYACMAAGMLTCAGFLLHIRDERRYSPAATLLSAIPVILLLTVASLYYGAFSGSLVFFVIAIYFFGLSQSRLLALGVFGACAAMNGGVLLLVTLGVLADDGVIQMRHHAAGQRALFMVVIEALLLGTLVFARMSARATLTAVEGLDRALRQIRQQEALLQEANQVVDAALRAGPAGRRSSEKVGPWVLGDLIGRGAMGEVYAARDPERGLDAAVKLLFPSVEDEPLQLRRFLREAEIMSRLKSPHVVEVYDSSDGADGLPYIAMERLAGHDLSWYLRKQRRLSEEATGELVTQVAAALEHARSQSIVHRDLKPQNLFYADSAGGRLWKVLDFGISRVGRSGTMTRGQVIGTPGYMAPEQARAGEVDHRADVFALSVIAYRALTGRPAFTGDDDLRILFSLVFMQPLRPGELATLPGNGDVDLALAIGLAKAPEDRYDTAAELAQALTLALGGRLSAPLRDRARRLLSRGPWGRRVV